MLYQLARHFLFNMDAETAHQFTLRALKSPLAPHSPAIQSKQLRLDLWGRSFPNPVGLAAGFDKNAEVIKPMFNLGFGFIEVGTVTPKPQAGNDRPRVFRDATHRAVINRMGFPNDGVTTFKNNLMNFLSQKPRPAGVLGINIGMNKDQTEPEKDYTLLIRTIGAMADYFTINISSPNTPGLRNLQDPVYLNPLLAAVMDERNAVCGEFPIPVLIKLAPDITDEQMEQIAPVLLHHKVDGVILTNTTLFRPEHLPESFRNERGGLSGAPLTDISTGVIRRFYALTKGQIPIIGVGGIMSGDDAYTKIRAGASLVQIYSGLIFEGPNLIRKINRDLLKYLKADGFTHISEAVGADHR